MRFKSTVFSALATGAMLFTATAHATLVSVPPATLSLAVPDNGTSLGGTLIADTGVMPAVASGSFSASVRETVVQEAGGTLDFYYQFFNSAGSSDALELDTNARFKGFTTDVAYLSGFDLLTLPGGTTRIAPSSVSRSFDGATVAFHYGFVLPGEAAYTVVIKTNATSYESGTIALQDSKNVTVNGFAPGPEPTSIALLGTCLFGLTFIVRKRIASRG